MTICTFPDCGRKRNALGLCQSHWKQQNKGEQLRPIRAKRTLEERKLSYQARALEVVYGVTLYELQTMWQEQDSKCANCQAEGPEEYMPSRDWPIDHDHSCCFGKKSCGKCVRGITCRPCNLTVLTVHVTKEVWEATGRYLGYV